MRRITFVLLLSAAPGFGQALKIDPAKLVDLTYAFDEKTIYWPTAKPFQWHKDVWGNRADGKWYSSATFTTSEHGGTHLDSPIHFSQGGTTLEQIPVSRFVGPARVIDISRNCAADRNYELSPADIGAYEKTHGALGASDIVLIRTGWGRFWPDRKLYLGDDTPGDASRLSFPGIGAAAARILASRHVSGVGIDTASLDFGRSTDFPAHRILNEANIFGLENVAHLERLPAHGATVFALPVKVTGGTGGPVRIIAILP